MKIFKLLLKAVFIFITILLCLYFYFDSDFGEIRRLKGQIEKNLNINLSELPELINRENYGWAEEGGDISLVKLNSNDCSLVSSVMTGEEATSTKSDHMKMFIKNKLKPASVKTWFYKNKHGDFTEYALDSSSCVLFRRYHYE